MQGLRDKGLGLAAISYDSTEILAAYSKQHGITFPLLSDPDHKVMTKYGAWGEKNMYGKITMGVIRSTVIIDPEGKVAYVYPKVRSAGHAEAVREQLAALRDAAA